MAKLRQLAKTDDRGTCSPDLGRQLLRKGLVERSMYNYHRTEWGKVVATLWRVSLTPDGKRVVGERVNP